jgi:diaminohydroxyphosphoribosylaminopyrimidine deaminase/5-amino-6-(5-phosphoribosylamino)uracil reductase
MEEIFMRRAFDLAANGRGKVSPNPMVGCVIVKDGVVIGEGWHMVYGGPHAEVNAIDSVSDKSLLDGADIYVTLEPCAHYGKTPPCAELLIKYPFRKVIIANTDPNPLVAGKGIQLLRDYGMEVITGILREYGDRLNARFFTFIQKKRPYVILKWAETADGFVARTDYSSKWISGQISRKLVHKWRTEEDAIAVGKNTAMYDNPQLNTRDWPGKNPVRVFIDRNLELPSHLNLFDGSQKTFCYNLLKDEESNNVTYVKLHEEDFIQSVLNDLYRRKIQSIIVEGGSVLLNLFISEGLYDEVRIFKAPHTFENGIPAPGMRGKPEEVIKIEEDELWVYYKK